LRPSGIRSPDGRLTRVRFGPLNNRWCASDLSSIAAVLNLAVLLKGDPTRRGSRRPARTDLEGVPPASTWSTPSRTRRQGRDAFGVREDCGSHPGVPGAQRRVTGPPPSRGLVQHVLSPRRSFSDPSEG
jgi:hypothetical protein